MTTNRRTRTTTPDATGQGIARILKRDKGVALSTLVHAFLWALAEMQGKGLEQVRFVYASDDKLASTLGITEDELAAAISELEAAGFLEPVFGRPNNLKAPQDGWLVNSRSGAGSSPAPVNPPPKKEAPRAAVPVAAPETAASNVQTRAITPEEKRLLSEASNQRLLARMTYQRDQMAKADPERLAEDVAAETFFIEAEEALKDTLRRSGVLLP